MAWILSLLLVCLFALVWLKVKMNKRLLQTLYIFFHRLTGIKLLLASPLFIDTHSRIRNPLLFRKYFIPFHLQFVLLSYKHPRAHKNVFVLLGLFARSCASNKKGIWMCVLFHVKCHKSFPFCSISSSFPWCTSTTHFSVSFELQSVRVLFPFAAFSNVSA